MGYNHCAWLMLPKNKPNHRKWLSFAECYALRSSHDSVQWSPHTWSQAIVQTHHKINGRTGTVPRRYGKSNRIRTQCNAGGWGKASGGRQGTARGMRQGKAGGGQPRQGKGEEGRQGTLGEEAMQRRGEEAKRCRGEETRQGIGGGGNAQHRERRSHALC